MSSLSRYFCHLSVLIRYHGPCLRFSQDLFICFENAASQLSEL